MASSAAGSCGFARQRAHGAGEAAHLVGRHTLGAQRREQRTGHRGREVRRRQQRQQRRGLGFVEIAALQQVLEGVARAASRLRSSENCP